LMQCVVGTDKEQNKVVEGQDEGFASNNDH
jgi:hypothetical protein